MNKLYDCIIIGGGISGLSAAMYLINANKNIVVFDLGTHGNLSSAPLVNNYPGLAPFNGAEFMDKFSQQIGSDNIIYEKVNEIYRRKDNVLRINKKYYSKYIIIATGTRNKELEVPVANSNLHYCALCDGGFYKNSQNVAVIGGGKSGLSSCIYLSSLGCHVNWFHRKSFNNLINEKLKTYNINDIQYENITEIEDNIIFYKSHKKSCNLFNSGYFICIGKIPNSNFKVIYQRDKVDYIDIDKDIKLDVVNYSLALDGSTVFHETSADHIYACGSVANRMKYDQAVIAAADGVDCALEVIEKLNNESK